MRSFVIPGAVLALLLGICLLSGAWLTARCEDWTAELADIDALAQEESWDAAEAQLETLYEKWQQVQIWLHITMEHEALNNAEALFCRAAVLAEEEDSVEFRAHIADLRSALQVLCETQQLRMENVL